MYYAYLYSYFPITDQFLPVQLLAITHSVGEAIVLGLWPIAEKYVRMNSISSGLLGILCIYSAAWEKALCQPSPNNSCWYTDTSSDYMYILHNMTVLRDSYGF